MTIANIILLSVLPLGGLALLLTFQFMSKQTPLARSVPSPTHDTTDVSFSIRDFERAMDARVEPKAASKERHFASR